jgi:peptide chain release factor
MSEAILHITAGKGPQESRWVVAQLARAFVREAKGMGLECELLDGVEDLPSSILLRISGDGASTFAARHIGTNQWIGTSPFRPAHKRRNWFVGVALAPEPEAITDLKEEDIDYQAMRATHRPTGLVATAQAQRSQHANRKLARLKLAVMLEERRGQTMDDQRRSQWQAHQDLERGNAVRVYVGTKFALKV